MAPISLSEPSPSQNHPSTTSANNDKALLQINGATTSCEITKLNLPVVALDVDVVTDAIAARLATSLLGHVLFLKNQIPLFVNRIFRVLFCH
jgi:hypothetical protein